VAPADGNGPLAAVHVHLLLKPVHELLSRSILFFGGKGGVGKTTCAAAFALGASRRGKRVLLVSTDPAHSTSDIFERAIGGSPLEIAPNLFGLEIDADTEARRYLDQAKARMAGVFSPSVMKEAARQIELTASMPGVADVAVFDRMAVLVGAEADRYDLLVFDTAPTGHTLRLLRLPELMGTWVSALAARRRDASAAAAAANGQGAGRGDGLRADPVLEILEARMARIEGIRAALTDRARTAFVLVLIPERLPIDESARAAHALADAGIHLGAVVVNRVLPEQAEGAYFQARKTQERVHLAEIERRLSEAPRVRVPQLESDVHGMASLGRVSASLLADSLRRG
jgi:arsenite/tail-anchored protein-transporting ATPase